MKKTILLLLVALFITSFTAQAEDKKEESKLKISGYVDTYYGYNFNEHPLPTSFTGAQNSFELGMANVMLSQNFDKVGFVADLGFGSRADAANDGAGLLSGSTAKAVKQLYVTYAPISALTITAGNFATFIGYESIDSPVNFNYSTSYMFSCGPFYHTGVKANYALTDSYGLMVGIFDNTDRKSEYGDKPKHFGAQFSFAPIEGFSGYLNFLTGHEALGVTGSQIDLTASYKATSALLVGLNATYKTYSIKDADSKSWAGGALYLNYSLSETAGLGCRAEYFGDYNSVNGLGCDIVGLTVSSNLKSGPLTFIPEVRVDLASKDIFSDKDGKATKTSPMVLLAAVYKF